MRRRPERELGPSGDDHHGNTGAERRPRESPRSHLVFQGPIREDRIRSDEEQVGGRALANSLTVADHPRRHAPAPKFLREDPSLATGKALEDADEDRAAAPFPSFQSPKDGAASAEGNDADCSLKSLVARPNKAGPLGPQAGALFPKPGLGLRGRTS